MNPRVGWKYLLEEFKKIYPTLAKSMSDWYPSGQMMITIDLSDGTHVLYNGVTRACKFINIADAKAKKSKTNMDYTEREWRAAFSKNLRERIEMFGITQRELANRSDMSEQMLSMYVKGLHTPTVYKAMALSRSLGCSLSELVEVR